MDYTKEDTITIDLSSIMASEDFTATTIEPYGTFDPYYGAIPPNVTIAGGGYLSSAPISDITFLDPNPSATITLRGEDADIDINGVSLMETLRGIQERLNILQPNAELEQEWDQLRELGEQYRRLEQELAEKSRAWKALKA